MPAPRQTRSPRRAEDQSLLKKIETNKWLIGLVVTALINTGIMYQQFTEIKRTLAENTQEQKAMNSKVSEVQLKQVGGLADIATLKSTDIGHESRISKLESYFMEMSRPRGK